MSLRERFSYHKGHQWRRPQYRAGSFVLADLRLDWTCRGVTVHAGLLGVWVALHYIRPADEWEAA